MQYNQQPDATKPMQVGGSRNANNMPLVDGQREWSYDLFDCLADPLTCVVSWFLPCVSYGRNRARYNSLENGTVSKDPMEGIISNETIMYGVAHGRAQTRGRYSIQGDPASDFFLACCCAPCSLTQESREIALEEQSLGHPGAGFSMFMPPPQSGAKHGAILLHQFETEFELETLLRSWHVVLEVLEVCVVCPAAVVGLDDDPDDPGRLPGTTKDDPGFVDAVELLPEINEAIGGPGNVHAALGFEYTWNKNGRMSARISGSVAEDARGSFTRSLALGDPVGELCTCG
ncbi:hypothetical protein MSAN_01588100 [Mycena sanguinolenta]|uniref:Uncharacterized protein n=1 Tax=Mycena sanguinolenta TaxID=230812 RepID=A0A8H6Y3K9_9AGAR|nr:hypothetical protein MSAN_01588100 [Mycena sanguinolenta]